MDNIPATLDSAKLTVDRNPSEILEEAHKAAKALSDVVSKKKKPVMINGEQFLEFEDWATVGRFYGITAKIISTAQISMGETQGYEAKAVALHVASGQEISAAEAMCLNDEQNWKNRPLFMLRSMAQTRAMAKALRNVLSWVVVLAGYRPTPAEEMEGVNGKGAIKEPQKKNGVKDKPKGELISEAQRNRFWAIAKSTKATDDQIKEWLFREYDFESTNEITRDLYDEICKKVKEALSDEPGSKG